MIFAIVASAAILSAMAAVVVARLLRLPWWATLLAAVVAWLGLALQLSLWETHEDKPVLTSARLTVPSALLGMLYAVVTRGMIGPPQGPLPRGH
jgi:hypothetical protein